ncbi:hypothetical protein [Gemmobacter caeni]|uniref:hypothetical protein n=1 Tax=Gemmobacter caeni TaxID=589035 RepID=UPI0011A408BA|nr:hypothetical protein [Gemmobacter caeni]
MQVSPILKKKIQRIAMLIAIAFSAGPVSAEDIRLSPYAIEALRQSGDIPNNFSEKDLPDLIARFAERNDIYTDPGSIYNFLGTKAGRRSSPVPPKIIDKTLKVINRYNPEVRQYKFDYWWSYKNGEDQVAICGHYDDARGIQFIRMRVSFSTGFSGVTEKDIMTGEQAAGMCLFGVLDEN